MADISSKIPPSFNISAALTRPWYKLHLRHDLEALYENPTAKARTSYLRVWSIVIAIVFLSCLGLDALAGPATLQAGLVLRAGLWLPISLLALFWLSTRRPVWVQGIAAGVPIIAGVAVTTWLARTAGAPYNDRYLMAAGMFCATVNICQPVRYRHAIVISVFALCAYIGIALSSPRADQTADLVGFFSVLTSLTPLTLRRIEFGERQAFLLRLLAEQRSLSLEAENQTLGSLTLKDTLTELDNRRSFDSAFNLRWKNAASSDGVLTLLIIDVDHFKKFNDAAGHQAGDECLRKIAAVIAHEASAFKNATCARYGGEEFVVLLSGEYLQHGMQLAERIRAGAEGLNVGTGDDMIRLPVTVSIGVCSEAVTAPNGAKSFFEAADRALYSAKHAGRNRVAVGYSNSLSSNTTGVLASENIATWQEAASS